MYQMKPEITLLSKNDD